jgi:cobalt-zinc-cadmium efflux system membrane fusion protein
MRKILYSLAISSLLFGCKESKDEEMQPKYDGIITITSNQFESMGIQIDTPKERSFDVNCKTSGKIDVPPQNRAQVTTFIGGYVKSTRLLVGDKVRNGQTLVTLESTEYLDIQKEYLEVAEQIKYLKSEFERQKTLFDEKISSQKNYLKAESDYRKVKGMYQSLREKLVLLNINPSHVEKGKLTSTVTISAPISGDIVVMNANVGMYIAPSAVILEIVDTQHLHLELAVFEKDILKVKIGQKIQFTVPEASKEVFPAEVHLVGKSIEGNDRTINVHGHLDEKIKQKLLTGMFVEASITTSSKNGLALPFDAVISENNKNYVLLLESEKNNSYSFKKVAVRIGEKNNSFIEVIPNNLINASSKIVVKGAFDIAN